MQNAGSRFPIRQQSGKIPLNAPLAAHPFIFSYMFLQIKKYSYIPEFDTLKVRKTKKKLAGDCCSGDFQPTNFFWVCNVF